MKKTKRQPPARCLYCDTKIQRPGVCQPCTQERAKAQYARQMAALAQEAAEPQTAKRDAGKPRLDLLPPSAIEAVGSVLEFGVRKYPTDSWRSVLPHRYLGAALRHVFAYLRGERLDAESGLHHLAHAACNVLFVLDMEMMRARARQAFNK